MIQLVGLLVAVYGFVRLIAQAAREAEAFGARILCLVGAGAIFFLGYLIFTFKGIAAPQ